MRSPRVLLIEDDATLRRVLSQELLESGFEVDAQNSIAAGERAAAGSEHELALLDLKLPDGSGLDLLPRLLGIDPDLQVVMLTGHGAVREAVTAIRLGAFDFLQKPTSLDQLERTLRHALDHRRLARENRGLRRIAEAPEDIGNLLGESSAMSELRVLLPKIARSDASVLISGESGSGKELVARSLHSLGPRCERPFVVVNCAAIPDALVESELFGHEKGAFTGADKKRTGLFEAADQGTIFLDEIGELPLAIQPILLRAIQFGEIRPVGSEREKRVDLRVVAATHRDLSTEVKAGRFREDLYWRIATVLVRVPPLRERRDDVPLLASAILASAAREVARPLDFTNEALLLLAQHDWPGNVRELENVVRRLAILTPGPTIGGEEVSIQLASAAPRVEGALPTLDLQALERLAVQAALERHKGVKRKAALELGVALKTLYNMIARHGLK